MAEELEQMQGGRLPVEISNQIVGVFRDFTGKGPSHCKTHWAGPDLLVVLLGGGYMLAEQTLYEGGRGMAVRDSRHALQDTLEARMSAVIEGLTGRTVEAFMSSSHPSPDLQAEAVRARARGVGELIADQRRRRRLTAASRARGGRPPSPRRRRARSR